MYSSNKGTGINVFLVIFFAVVGAMTTGYWIIKGIAWIANNVKFIG